MHAPDKTFKIICFGLAVADLYGRHRRDILKRRFSAFTDMSVHPGGDAVNAADNFALMGSSARLIGLVGDDPLALSVKRTVEGFGVDTKYLLTRQDSHTAASLFFSTASEGLSLIHAPGGNKQLTADMLTDEMMAGYDHFYYASIYGLPSVDGDGAASLLRRAREMGMTTSMDTSGTGERAVMEKSLQYCDIFTPNDQEIKAATGLTDMEDIKAYFKGFGLKILGVTRGAKGVFLTNFEEDVTLPSLFKGEIVDQVGAGDAFLSTFVLAYKYGYSLRDCGVIASAGSALCLSMRGASLWGRPFPQVVEYARSLGYDVAQM
ncbi:MAG: carbohydrate kinase family protein [Christensenellales bacterium]|jgi:sugar/nucleoside kinase (ribokinase family)